MRIHKQFFKSISLTALLATGFTASGIAQDTTSIVDPETKAPIILSTSPNGGEMNVDPGSVIEITFSSDMDEKSINGSTLMLHATYTDTMYKENRAVMLDDQIRDRSAVNNSKKSWQYTTSVVGGTISYANKIAVFTPNMELDEGTLYTFTVTSGVTDLKNIPLESDQVWSFTIAGMSDSAYYDSKNNSHAGPGAENRSMSATSTKSIKIIDLGKADNFVILAKKDVKNDSSSRITGDVGEGSAIKNSKIETGMSNSTRQSTTDMSVEMRSSKSKTASADVTEALKDMMSAFADATMLDSDDLTSHKKNDDFNSIVITAGVYEWSDSLNITSDVTLSGSAEDVWLFKANKDLTVQENTKFTLTEGALAENIFWYVEGNVTIGKDAHFEGTILSINEITLENGAQLNGRMFSQTSITLDDNTITEPRSMGRQASSSNE